MPATRWRKAAAALGAARRKAGRNPVGRHHRADRANWAWAAAASTSRIEPIDAERPDPQGGERVEFLVAANPGQPPRALRKVASGGELSRISLAIEVAALGLDAVPTMVFDEVDSGIGGGVAEIVGQKLRALGAKRQVLCVTHLPQVAAQGHAHYRVSKAASEGVTQSAVQSLDAKQREEELARMLGGVEMTREARAAAKRLLSDVDLIGRESPVTRVSPRAAARPICPRRPVFASRLSRRLLAHVQHQRVLLDLVAMLGGDLALQLLDLAGFRTR